MQALQPEQGPVAWLATQERLTFSSLGWYLGVSACDIGPRPGKFNRDQELPLLLRFRAMGTVDPDLQLKGWTSHRHGWHGRVLYVPFCLGNFPSHESRGKGEPAFYQQAEKARTQLSQEPLQSGSGHVTRASQSEPPT